MRVGNSLTPYSSQIFFWVLQLTAVTLMMPLNCAVCRHRHRRQAIRIRHPRRGARAYHAEWVGWLKQRQLRCQWSDWK